MNAENQKIILDAVSRLFNALAIALDREACSYEDGICFIRDHGDKTLFELLVAVITRTVPIVGQEQNLTSDSLPIFLDAMDTRKKAEDFLATFPDPDPAKLKAVVRELNSFLPSVRKILTPFAKQLPSDPGGHPRRIPEQEEPKVREEIAQLFNDGYDFPAAKKEVARRRNASLSTIQRICRKGNTSIDRFVGN
jgi:hypothetical protein